MERRDQEKTPESMQHLAEGDTQALVADEAKNAASGRLLDSCPR